MFSASDWLLPFLSGVGATVVGFALTMIWDMWKMRGEKRQREATITRSTPATMVPLLVPNF
jgi:adenosylmethionine-8-amino-7-oxononanoate aminotransferase